VERWKCDGNMEVELKFCKTKTQAELFWRKWKQKRNNAFRQNGCENGISLSE
jgi:hypothetical protein